MAKWEEHFHKLKAKAQEAAAKKQKAQEKAQETKAKQQKRKQPAKPQPSSNGQQQMEQFMTQSHKLPRQQGMQDVAGSSMAGHQLQQQSQQQHHLQQQQHQQHQQQQQGQQDSSSSRQFMQASGQGLSEMPPPPPVQQQMEKAAQEPQGRGGLVQQEVDVQGKVLLYEALKQHYDTDDTALPVSAVGQKPRMPEVKKIQKMLDTMKCKGEEASDFAGSIGTVYAYYQRMLQQCNAADFNDLLGLAVKLFTEQQGILQQQQQRFPFLLVDEYQDCNKQQVDIVDKLQKDIGRVTVVGDDAQSIYRFRGAQPGVFQLFKAVYKGNNLQRELEQNYRSTPQILAVGKALLKDSGTIPKNLLPTQSSAGKPPVKLLVLDTEDEEAAVIAQEAKRVHTQNGVPYGEMAVLFRAFRFNGGRSHSKLQKCLTREGVPFVLVRDSSLFERVEVLDTLAYVKLALNPSDDAAFMRVLNVPSRKLGPKLKAQLEEAQEQAFTREQEQQQQQAGQPVPAAISFFSIAGELLRQGRVATLHAKRLEGFLATIQRLSRDAMGQTPAEVVLSVLSHVPGFVQHIENEKRKKKKQEHEGDLAAAEEEAQQDDDGNDEQSGHQHGLNGHTPPVAAAAAASGGSAAFRGGFVTAKQAMSQQQQQQDSAQTMSHDSRATAGMSGATAEDDEGNNSEADESDSEEGEEQAAMHDIGDTPKELVTSSLVALYAEAVAFGAEWAATHGTTVQAAPSGSAANTAPSAAGATVGATQAQDADGLQQPASPPLLGVPSLYDMTAAMVNDMFKPKQLLDVGVPELLVEEVYAAAGKGFRPLSDFLAHISLNPHTEQRQHPGKQGTSGQQQQADALTISTIHAAKGLEYNTVWVARWVEGFLPCNIRKSDIEGLQEDPAALLVAERDRRV